LYGNIQSLITYSDGELVHYVDYSCIT